MKKQARNEADLEAYLMRELAVLKHFQHDNLLQYIGASNAAASEPGGERSSFSHFIFFVARFIIRSRVCACLRMERMPEALRHSREAQAFYVGGVRN